MTETRPYPQRARERIKSTLIIKRLMAHIQGEVEMSSTQIQAARILLGKTLPDVRSTELKGNVQINHTERLTDEQLMAIASGAYTHEAIVGQAERVQEPLKLASKSKDAG